MVVGVATGWLAHPVVVTRAARRAETSSRFRLPASGHGGTAFVRRRPVRIVDGRFEGGYTDLFELICPDCGDHSYLDYSEVPSRLQWLRGPRPLAGVSDDLAP